MTITATLACALSLTACGGSSSSNTAAAPADTAAASANTIGSNESNDTTDTATPAATGNVDCAYLRDPANQGAFLGLQLIAQIKRQSVVDSIKTGPLTFDPAQLNAFLQKLAPLGGQSYPPFGDPKKAIDLFLASNAKAAELLAIDGPVPQAKFDELAAVTGETAAFIGAQASIGPALDANCPRS